MGKLGPAESQSCGTHQYLTECQKEDRGSGSGVMMALQTQVMPSPCDTMDVLWVLN